MKSLWRVALLLAALLAATGPARGAAQQRPQPVTRTVVVYTLSTIVRGDGAPAVPATLLERLSAEPRLASLSVEKPEDRAEARLVAQFVFEDEAEFRRWYASEAARRLIDLLGREGGAPAYNLELRRFPLADLLRAAG
ncbi:MAG TPA: hypothetical protein VF746_23120 [Longimicrobium sp.]|jgi:hypothetical protein